MKRIASDKAVSELSLENTRRRRIAELEEELARLQQIEGEPPLDSEQRERLFVLRAPVAVAMFDPQMRYVAVNSRFIEDFRLADRFTDSTIVGHSHYDVFPELPEAWRLAHQRVLAGETLKTDLERFDRSDGKTDWLRWDMNPWHGADGSIAGAVLICELVTERVETQRALEASERKFRTLVDAVADVVWRSDAEGTVWIETSDWRAGGGAPLRAWSRDEWLAQLHAEDRARVAATWDASFTARGDYLCEYRVRRPDGLYRWTQGRAKPLFAPDGAFEGMIGMNRDIHDRREAEQQLRVNEERIRLATSGVRVGIWEADLRNYTGYWSPEAVELLGFNDMEEITPFTWGEAIHPEDRERTRAAWRQAVANGDQFEIEFRTCKPAKDGGERWLVSRGRAEHDPETGVAIRSAGVLLDVTRRVRAQQAQRATDSMFRAITELLPAMVSLADSSGALLFTNGRLAEYLGQDVSLFSQADLFAFLHPDDVADVRDIWLRALHSGEPYQAECRVKRHDGVWRWMLSRGVPQRDESGRIVRWLRVAVDIDDVRRTEESLRRSEAILSAVLDALPVGVIIADASGKIVRDNAANRELWGVPPDVESWEQYGEWVGWWPETGKRIQAHEWAMARALLHGEMTRGELVENQKFNSTERRFYLNNAAPIRNAAGEIVAGVVAELDVTERRRAEQHRELLMQELNHRVKNTLATVQSIAALSLRNGCEPHVRADFQARLRSLAHSHDLLTRESWSGAGLKDIALAALQPLLAEDRAERIQVEGANLWLDPRAAVACSMAFHELATNAIKYGALSVEAGTVQLQWSGEELVVLEWREAGGPPVALPQRRGFGLRMIEDGLAHALGGTVAIDFAPSGLICRIELPRRRYARTDG